MTPALTRLRIQTRPGSLTWILVHAAASLLLSYPAMAQDVAPVTPQASSARLDRLLEAQKEAEARQAIRAAQADLIPSSGVEGTVGVGDHAGEAEAFAIAALQTRDVADRIYAALPEGGRSALVAPGASRPDTTAYLAFDLRRQAVLGQLTGVKGVADEILSQSVAVAPGTVIAIGTALLSYFRSDYQVDGIAVTGVSNDSLVAALLQGRSDTLQPLDAGRVHPDTINAMRRDLAEIDTARRALERARRTCVQFQADYDAEVNAKDADKPAVRRSWADRLDLCTTLATALTSYTGFATDMGASAAGFPEILKQYDIHLQLKTNRLLLVEIDTRGSGYTQQNIVSHLGGMPFHVSVVSWAHWRLLDTTGRLQASGDVPVHSGYRRVNDVEALILAGRIPPSRAATPRRTGDAQ